MLLQIESLWRHYGHLKPLSGDKVIIQECQVSWS